MPWEKKSKVKVKIPILKTGTNLNRTEFTFESLQNLIKGLEKSGHYRTIVFDTITNKEKEL